MAFTATSATYLAEELEAAGSLAAELGVAHVVAETDEFDDPSFVGNARDRCYHCKRHLVERMAAVARERGCDALLDGANLDDLGDHRPGMLAAAEAGVRHPLLEAGLGKAAVRALAQSAGPRHLGRAAAGVPGVAPALRRADHARQAGGRGRRGAGAARDLGFRQCRVRHHGQVARVEVEARRDRPGGRAGARRDRAPPACRSGSPTWPSTSMVSDREA